MPAIHTSAPTGAFANVPIKTQPNTLNRWLSVIVPTTDPRQMVEVIAYFSGVSSRYVCRIVTRYACQESDGSYTLVTRPGMVEASFMLAKDKQHDDDKLRELWRSLPYNADYRRGLARVFAENNLTPQEEE